MMTSLSLQFEKDSKKLEDKMKRKNCIMRMVIGGGLLLIIIFVVYFVFMWSNDIERFLYFLFIFYCKMIKNIYLKRKITNMISSFIIFWWSLCSSWKCFLLIALILHERILVNSSIYFAGFFKSISFWWTCIPIWFCINFFIFWPTFNFIDFF